MEPTLIAISIYLADKIAAQFVKDDIYTRLRDYFHPKTSYRSLLQQLIVETIDAYHKTGPETEEALPFYFHREIFEHLMMFVLFKSNSTSLLEDLFKRNPEIKRPKKEHLIAFFDFFVTKARANNRLRKYFIDENYKTEIFQISSQLQNAERNIDYLVAAQQGHYQPNLEFYVSRPGEEQLYQLLEDKRLLLLTGPSFCGKSLLAKNLASRSASAGFRFLSGDDFEHCRLQLNQTIAPSVYLLEDPFGHVFHESSIQSYQKLEQFLMDMPHVHRLIITSRKEIVLQVNQKTALDECSIFGNAWVDLNVTDQEFIMRYWNAIAARKKLSFPVQTMMTLQLKAHFQNDILQPGQLSFLANQPDEILEGKDGAELSLLAKVDSNRLAAEIANKGQLYQKLYIALGLSCDTIRSVSMSELNFLMSDYPETPALLKSGITTKSFRDLDKTPDFPVYVGGYSNIGYVQALTELQMRGYIEITGQLIVFTHPTYRDIGRYLVKSQRADIQALVQPLLLRALSVLRVSNVLVCIAALREIYQSQQAMRSDLQQLFISVAKRTIFPAAKDKLTELLIALLDELNDEDQGQVQRMIHRRTDVSDIFWHEGIPFYDKKSINTSRWLGRETEDNGSFSDIVEKVNQRTVISSEDIWEMLELSWRKKDISMLSDTGLAHIFTYDEGFLKARLAYLIFALGKPSEPITKLVFEDHNPEVIVEAIKGCFTAISSYTVEEREEIIKKINEVLTIPSVLIRASDFLCWFGLDHPSESLTWNTLRPEEKQLLWDVWGESFPIFLRNLPDHMDIPNSARYAANLDKASDFLNSRQALDVSAAIMEWINKKLHRSKHIDSHVIGIISFLMDSNAEAGAERLKIIATAAGVLHTGFAISTVATLTQYWDELTPEEHTVVKEVLRSERADVQWIRAAVVAQNAVPRELQAELFADEALFDRMPEEILAAVEPSLVQKTLSVYFGSPGQLWDLAPLHQAESKWVEVIHYIIVQSFEPHFELCLEEMIGSMVNGGGDIWNDGEKIFDRLCALTTKEDLILNVLIKETSESTYTIESTTYLWQKLIKLFADKGRTEHLNSVMLEYFEALQTGGAYEFLQIIGDHMDSLLVHLPLDNAIIELFVELHPKDGELLNTDNIVASVDKIIEIADTSRLRLAYCFQLIEEIVSSDLAQKHSVVMKLKELPDLTEQNSEKQSSKFKKDEEISDWLYLAEIN